MDDYGVECDACFDPSTNRRIGYNGLYLCPECWQKDSADFENGWGDYGEGSTEEGDCDGRPDATE